MSVFRSSHEISDHMKQADNGEQKRIYSFLAQNVELDILLIA